MSRRKRSRMEAKDLFLATPEVPISKVSVLDAAFSDHLPILLCINSSVVCPQPTLITQHSFKHWALVSFTHVVRGTTHHCHLSDEHWVFSEHFPSIISTSSSIDQMPSPLSSSCVSGCSWNYVCRQVGLSHSTSYMLMKGERQSLLH